MPPSLMKHGSILGVPTQTIHILKLWQNLNGAEVLLSGMCVCVCVGGGDPTKIFWHDMP